ncbi:MAG: ATPase [Muribaculaceae bacterium]|nr:ATPase [Muribaculaceae bacterium]
MNNKIIVDAGSSKVEWTLLSNDGKVLQRMTSDGVNALMISSAEATRHFSDIRDALGQSESVSEVHYYGAGCATSVVCDKIHQVLSGVWQAGIINVSSDLLGAARSLFGHEEGIACILGTGSNSCLYDGKEIIKNVPSLGYILGDEGSGSSLGRRLIADAFKGHLPSAIKDSFISRYKVSLPDILDNVYRSPKPNKYMASLVPFLSEHLWNPYIYSLVLEEFTNFVKRNIAMYPGAHSLPIAFTGSIAYYFEEILTDALERQGYKVSKVTRTPMEGLIAFHSK